MSLVSEQVGVHIAELQTQVDAADHVLVEAQYPVTADCPTLATRISLVLAGRYERDATVHRLMDELATANADLAETRARNACEMDRIRWMLVGHPSTRKLNSADREPSTVEGWVALSLERYVTDLAAARTGR